MIKNIIVVVVTAVVAILGTLVINGFVGARMVGKMVPNHWAGPLVDTLLYTGWFLAVALFAALLFGRRPVRWLAVSAALVLAFFLFVAPAPWVNPELSVWRKAFAYFVSYIAGSMVLPAFLAVGYLLRPRRLREPGSGSDADGIGERGV